jgi:REP element-mobilizing transposase RayT
MELPKRKPTRLKEYDYSQNGAYFVTICTHNKEHLLSNIVGEGFHPLPKNILTKIGNEIEKSIQYINDNYIGITISKYVIMPNHVHLIVFLDNSGGHGNPPLQNIIGQLKSYTTKKFGNILWQRSFHDHIIRDKEDYNKIWEYIDTNVTKWELDCFYIK